MNLFFWLKSTEIRNFPCGALLFVIIFCVRFSRPAADLLDASQFDSECPETHRRMTMQATT